VGEIAEAELFATGLEILDLVVPEVVITIPPAAEKLNILRFIRSRNRDNRDDREEGAKKSGRRAV
jgi:hypothetical protein